MKSRILAIDSNAFNLAIIKQVMELAGHQVVTALDGASGLQQFHNCQPDLVILDVMLPAIDGWEVCQRIRNTSSIPIIIHTALESSHYLLQAMKAGANDYLVKPALPEMIKIRIETLLKHQVRREQGWPEWLPYVSSPQSEFVQYRR